MSSLSKKDRVSLCSFTLSDGRRCRTPRIGNHPHFCFYHAQKEARARAAETLGNDLAYFFSGDYLSACDLSTALARLIPAVVRGDVKPKTARTVAYLAQTLLQTIHISQHEYINAFGSDGWRKSVRNSVNGNRDYLFPPDPEPQQSESPQPQPTAVAHPLRDEAFRSAGATSPAPPQTQAQQPASAPPSNPPQPAAHPIPAPSPTSPPASQTPASTTDVTHPIPATQPAPSFAPTPPPSCPEQGRRVNPPQPRPSTPPPSPNREARALQFDQSCRLLIDGKPF